MKWSDIITKYASTVNTSYALARKIDWIIIHYTAGVTSKSGKGADSVAWFNNPSAQASADLVVDDANVYLKNSDILNRYCWAIGGSKYSGTKGGRYYGIAVNKNVISIEICSNNKTGKMTYANDPNYYFTDAAVKRALELTKLLMERYNIKADHVIRHWDVNGKPCPGIIGWNGDSGDESKWRAFHAALTASTSTPKEEEKPVNDFGIKYSAHVQGKGWLPVVHDGLIAGTTGESRRLEALKIVCPKAKEGETQIKVSGKAHIQGIGWKSYGEAEELIIGTTGESRRLEAVELTFTGIPSGKKIHYQAHCQSIGWQAEVLNGFPVGTTGMKKSIEAFKIWCC
jgi:N-acetylmuramoyl-L-alanine amidase CwlA